VILLDEIEKEYLGSLERQVKWEHVDQYAFLSSRWWFLWHAQRFSEPSHSTALCHLEYVGKSDLL